MDLLPNAAIESLKQDASSDKKDICIIGAGPGGLAALQIIMESPQYKEGLWHPTAFEERDKVGGIWVPAPPKDDPPITPLYDSLTTNLPHPIMCYDSLPFPPSTALFPHAVAVEKYLADFATHFNLFPHIRLETTVLGIDWDASTAKWRVSVSSGEEHAYDLLIVANGHYRVPRYPATPGIATWIAAGKAMHSAWYRHPEHKGRTVLVVGGGPSGLDISAELRGVARVVIHSVTDGVPEDSDDGTFKRRGLITEYLDVGEGKVVFEDGSTETGIDHCIVATGYQHHQPYFPPSLLRVAVPPPVPPIPPTLYNSTYHLFPLARHLFPLSKDFPPSRICFLGLLKGVAPLPLMEAQVRAALKIFAEPEHFDSTQESIGVIARYEELRARVGADELRIAATWHIFAPQEQFDYRDELHAWIGEEDRVPAWVREMYDKRDVLRAEWRDLERLGEADEWVHGVGEGGMDEWVEMMRKLLRRAEDRKREECKTRL
ncbi:FAD/NAD(P)-binding domain-containing protein [Laetiporus sulphureus 93-53]|uniref:FAD/NAD(P)-binding domain-containing protein n=1 Tax=Laetiporus sulphureus 93-53 TaxID=1314785 RepID=A0A165DA99_9APHY|nr:FAD/NAD(P)-binding domain-containing protein [Laetiporus sulphureus 93-53]KZT04427.1 FAD/NAD(P)-binding domain-containing protein [Laetiporus sulphureus 93-53]